MKLVKNTATAAAPIEGVSEARKLEIIKHLEGLRPEDYKDFRAALVTGRRPEPEIVLVDALLGNEPKAPKQAAPASAPKSTAPDPKSLDKPAETKPAETKSAKK